MSNYAIRNFNSGEVSPALYARTDLVKYATGARTVRNFIVRKQGGLDNRPGSELVGLCQTSSAVRILGFVFNDDQAYVLHFTALQLRFARAGAFIAYTIATPYAAADLAALQITQSADVVTIVHPSYAVRELRRLSETSWTLTAVVFAPSIAAPTGLTATTGSAGLSFVNWVVTALAESGEESYASNIIGVIANPLFPQAVPAQTLQWTAVVGAVGYNIYKAYLSLGTASVTSFGLVGTTLATQFFDNRLTPDPFNQPPAVRTVFGAAGDYPSAVGQFQQRQLYAGSTNEPEKVFTSRSADRDNFTVSIPIQDDDAITFGLLGRKVNAIRHIVDAGALLIFTSGGEWIVSGDGAGVLRPTDVNARNVSSHGSSLLPPIQTDARVIYVQARQSVVRDMGQDTNGKSSGSDLTLFADHLFTQYTLADWAYQEVPNSIVWVVRSDGVLLGLTDVPEQDILGWHHHDTDGLYENVCVIPEDGEDRIYVVVNRDGVRMLERFASRTITDIEDAIFLDSAMTYDGRNTNTALTMTLLGGTTWASDELLTVTANALGTFSSSNVGDQVVLTGSDGTVIRFTIANYTTSAVVTGFSDITVPAVMRSVAITTYSIAVNQVSGLSHLNGKAVSVFADAFVVANPNNPRYTTTVTVVAGVATLPGPYSYVHVGLPYVSDLQTLDLDTPSGASMRDKKILINRVTLELEASRGIFAGRAAPVDDSTIAPLMEFKLRDTENYNDPVSLLTGVARINIENVWDQDRNGRVFIRQIDPLPLSILATIPTGVMPPGST